MRSGLGILSFTVFAVSVVKAINLATWMGDLGEAISDQPLFEISLPGSYQSLSYDLFAGNVTDRHIIRDLLVPDSMNVALETYQSMNITAQLDSGARFLDFRVQGLLSPCQPITSHLMTVFHWLSEHTEEVLLVWLNSDGTHAVSWQSIENIFGSLLASAAAFPPISTPLSEYRRQGARILFVMSGGAGGNAVNSEMLISGNMEISTPGTLRGSRVDSAPRTYTADSFSDSSSEDFVLVSRPLLISLTPPAPSALPWHLALKSWGEWGGRFAENFLPVDLEISSPLSELPSTGLDLAALGNYYGQAIFNRTLPPVVLIGALTEQGHMQIDRAARSNWTYPVVYAILAKNTVRGCKREISRSFCLDLLKVVRGHLRDPRYWEDRPHGRVNTGK